MPEVNIAGLDIAELLAALVNAGVAVKSNKPHDLNAMHADDFIKFVEANASPLMTVEEAQAEIDFASGFGSSLGIDTVRGVHLGVILGRSIMWSDNYNHDKMDGLAEKVVKVLHAKRKIACYRGKYASVDDTHNTHNTSKYAAIQNAYHMSQKAFESFAQATTDEQRAEATKANMQAKAVFEKAINDYEHRHDGDDKPKNTWTVYNETEASEASHDEMELQRAWKEEIK